MSILSDNLRELRIKKGVQQKEIAEKINVSKASYSLYERGDREPSIAIIRKLAEYFNVSMNELLLLEDDGVNIVDSEVDRLRKTIYGNIQPLSKEHLELVNCLVKKIQEFERESS